VAEPTVYYLTTAEAAVFLGVSKSYLEKKRWLGGGPEYRKHGALVMYDPADLRAWSDARTRTSTSESAQQAAERKESEASS
jgi:hypothetical protein